MISTISNKKSYMSRLGDFFNWWSNELAGLLPGFIKRFFQVESYRVYLNPASGKISLVDLLNEKVLEELELEPDANDMPASFKTILSRLNSNRVETQLILASQDALLLDVELPAEAESNLQNILGYEMDRQTPFKIDQVYYDYEIEKSSRNIGHILVKLVVVPREIVKHWIERVNRWGYSPAVVTVAGSESGKNLPEASVNLLPPELRSSKPQRVARLNYFLVTSALAILLAMALLLLHQQNVLIDSLKMEIELVSDDVQEVQRLRKKIDHLVFDYTRVVERKQQSLNVIEIVNDLTFLIPDHTSLQRFEVNGTRVKLQGESTNASELIGLIESSEKFRNAAFTSPVVRDAKTGRDRFQILANLASQVDES